MSIHAILGPMSEKYQETAPLATVFDIDDKISSDGEDLEAGIVL